MCLAGFLHFASAILVFILVSLRKITVAKWFLCIESEVEQFIDLQNLFQPVY